MMSDIAGLRIGFCLTGSFCTFARVFTQMEALAADGAQLIPIISNNVDALDTRFFSAAEVKQRLRDITGREPLRTIPEVEPIGPKALTDLMIVAPCTGNTLAKLACGLVDTPVTMAVKSHLRGGKPVLLAVSTNDALGAAARNIGALLNYKHIYFLPLEQDDYVHKPNSIVARMELMREGALAALEGRNLQPMLRERAVG
ncbi:MAG TPA: dipicolinate synthase subunit B [Candidatus Fimadaptatus faecigallinarum]|uniref:Dipicolinate synthase subunit B n=1 Tax=Candidatus Fimadaptatus faecigallinarum TaxID=2840814 RepID=A0A9D1LRN5_9FIRM|nr:dipicolinate synthase subunit B [Candidatus Fimadaptatus faecigallinarum]